MKRIAVSCALIVLTLSLGVFPIYTANEMKGIDKLKEEFSHTVLAEYGGITRCPYCPAASELLYRLYTSSEYQFYYITFVIDKNSAAKRRMVWGYLDRFVPTTYFDGGYMISLGSNETEYRNAIEKCGARDVHDINMEMTAKWEEGKIIINLCIENLEKRPYLGWLRVYVTEKESRWQDYNGNSFHFALIDFASNKPVFLFGNKNKNISIEWTPNMEGIESNNIMIIAAVSNIFPHLKKNPWDRPKPVTFLAFYVDQVTAVEPR